MAQASLVWKKLFFPPQQLEASESATAKSNHSFQQGVANFKTPSSTPTPVEEIDFSKDDGEALWLLLNIVHLRFVKIPAALNVETFCQVAIICDKYACAHLVKPWPIEWLGQENQNNADIGKGREQWLLIGWVFGQAVLFENIAESIVLDLGGITESNFSGVSNTVTHTGGNLKEPLPPGIQGR